MRPSQGNRAEGAGALQGDTGPSWAARWQVGAAEVSQCCASVGGLRGLTDDLVRLGAGSGDGLHGRHLRLQRRRLSGRVGKLASLWGEVQPFRVNDNCCRAAQSRHSGGQQQVCGPSGAVGGVRQQKLGCRTSPECKCTFALEHTSQYTAMSRVPSSRTHTVRERMRMFTVGEGRDG